MRSRLVKELAKQLDKGERHMKIEGDDEGIYLRRHEVEPISVDQGLVEEVLGFLSEKDAVLFMKALTTAGARQEKCFLIKDDALILEIIQAIKAANEILQLTGC